MVIAASSHVVTTVNLYYAYGQMDTLVDEDPYYAQLGWDSPTRQDMYRRFIAIESPYEKQLDPDFLNTPF
jgi:hypothetical protein